MASRSPVQVCFAPSGSGKTYVLGPARLIEEFLPMTAGIFCSNLPLFAEKIAAMVSAKTGEPPSVYEDRLRKISPETLKEWAEERGGPWLTFDGMSIEGWHIAIDEAHNFIGEKHSKDHKRKWQQWLGELRHRGATCMLISQDDAKVAREVIAEAGFRMTICNSEERRDPLFNIPMGDWYELRAKFVSGAYESSAWEVHYRKLMRKWVKEYEKKWPFRDDYFAAYDSYSTPHAGGVKAKGPPHLYKKHSHLWMLKWFVLSHPWPLFSRCLLAAVIMWVSFFGGAKIIMNEFMWQLSGKRQAALKAKQGKASAVVVDPVTGEPTLADPVETAVMLRRSLNETEQAGKDIQQRMEVAEKAVAELQALLAAGYVITALGPDWCSFETGDVYKIGQTIEGGPYVGQKLVAVDWERRRVEFSSGEVVFLGSRPAARKTALDKFVPETVSNAANPQRPGVQVASRPLSRPAPAPEPDGLPANPQPSRRLPAFGVESGSGSIQRPLPPNAADGERGAIEAYERAKNNNFGKLDASRGVLALPQQ